MRWETDIRPRTRVRWVTKSGCYGYGIESFIHIPLLDEWDFHVDVLKCILVVHYFSFPQDSVGEKHVILVLVCQRRICSSVRLKVRLLISKGWYNFAVKLQEDCCQLGVREGIIPLSGSFTDGFHQINEIRKRGCVLLNLFGDYWGRPSRSAVAGVLTLAALEGVGCCFLFFDVGVWGSFAERSS